MPSFNSVVLLGHLAADPELRYTPEGAPVCDFTIASTSTSQSPVTSNRCSIVPHRLTSLCAGSA